MSKFRDNFVIGESNKQPAYLERERITLSYATLL